jgi:hypothetical protein
VNFLKFSIFCLGRSNRKEYQLADAGYLQTGGREEAVSEALDDEEKKEDWMLILIHQKTIPQADIFSLIDNLTNWT